MTYEQAKTMFETTRKRKLAGNTYLVKTDNGYGIRYHWTIILDFRPDCTVLNSGGWRTVTTKARLNQFGPVSIHQQDFIWYVQDSIPFYDGMKILTLV